MACFTTTELFDDNDELLLGKVNFFAFAVGVNASRHSCKTNLETWYVIATRKITIKSLAHFTRCSGLRCRMTSNFLSRPVTVKCFLFLSRLSLQKKTYRELPSAIVD